MINTSIQDKGKCNKQRKVALMGDSIFDNEPYVSPGKAVIDQISLLNKCNWNAELLAVDGAIIKDVANQCEKIKEDITHLVVSIGGNDALGYIGVFEESVSSVFEGMQILSEIRAQFQKSYQSMLQDLISLKRNFALCTIYNTCPGIDVPLLTSLSIFNDVIFHEAFKLGVPVLDLRLSFSSPSDYSSVSPIEPSETGGMKIAKTLKQLMETYYFSDKRSVIYH